MLKITKKNKDEILKYLGNIIRQLNSDDVTENLQGLTSVVGLDKRIFDEDIVAKFNEITATVDKQLKESTDERKRRKQSNKT